MNGLLSTLARIALACGCLALSCECGLGEVVVGGGPGHLVGVVVEGDAIGDPWWDEAEEKAGAERKPDAAAAGQAGVELHDFGQHLRQLGLAALRRELSVVRQTCPSLERQQRALVLAAGRGAIDAFVAGLAGGAVEQHRGRSIDIAAAVATAVRTSVAANATEEESAAYEAEQKLRAERVRQAAAAVLVAEVDRHAFLDEAERESLGRAFAAAYRERWRPALEAVQRGQAGDLALALPGVERCVEQALGRDRTMAWQRRREEATKLAATAGQPVQMQMQQLQRGPLRMRIQAFGNGQQQVIVNGQQLIVGEAGGGVQLQVQVQAGGAVEIQPAPKDAEAKPEDEQ